MKQKYRPGHPLSPAPQADRILRERRSALGLTQEEAVALGVASDRTHLSHAETGWWQVSRRRLAEMLAIYDLHEAVQAAAAIEQPGGGVASSGRPARRPTTRAAIR